MPFDTHEPQILPAFSWLNLLCLIPKPGLVLGVLFVAFLSSVLLLFVYSF